MSGIAGNGDYSLAKPVITNKNPAANVSVSGQLQRLQKKKSEQSGLVESIQKQLNTNENIQRDLRSLVHYLLSPNYSGPQLSLESRQLVEQGLHRQLEELKRERRRSFSHLEGVKKNYH